MTPRQARAARAMLGLDMKEVCALAGIGKRTLTEFEAGGRSISEATTSKIKAFYIGNGLHFSEPERGESVGFVADNGAIPALSSGIRSKREYLDLLAVEEVVDRISSILEIQKQISERLTISQSIIFATLERSGLQQKDLAKQLNCTPAFISAIAVGKKTIPLSGADKLQNYFEIDRFDVQTALRQEKLIAKLSSQLISLAEESRQAWLHLIP